MRSRLLDLFCGIGGCSVGYHRAGFDVTGVDIAPQPRYPFLDIIQGDALDILTDLAFLAQFDVIHASPPCQSETDLRHRTGGHRSEWTGTRRPYDDLLTPTLRFLAYVGIPWIVENVESTRKMPGAITLCGSMFGLGHEGAVLRRHRLFLSNRPLAAPPDDCRGKRIVGVYGSGGAWTRTAPGGGGVKVSGSDAANAMGIDWTDHQAGLAQAIPPAYTEYLGSQLLDHLRAVA